MSNSISIDEIVLLVLKYVANESGEVEGKTLLQKTIYFANVIQRLGLKFSPYYYGPYSSDVTASLKQMRKERIIQEEVDIYSDSWFSQCEPKLFRYRLTSFGNELATVIEEEHKEIADKIKSTVEKIREASSSDYKILSIAGKMYSILQSEEKSMSHQDIIEEAKFLGWTIAEEEAKQAIKLLEKLGLVKEAD